MNHRSWKFLHDIKHFADGITKQIHGKNLSDYEDDEWLRLGVERSLENIGIALIALEGLDARLLENITGYRSIIGMRNILAHEYVDIDNEQVWNALIKDLPVLIDEVERLMS